MIVKIVQNYEYLFYEIFKKLKTLKYLKYILRVTSKEICDIVWRWYTWQIVH